MTMLQLRHYVLLIVFVSWLKFCASSNASLDFQFHVAYDFFSHVTINLS